MTTPTVPTVTNDLIAELEAATEYQHCDMPGAAIRALLAERADLKQQAVDREAHVRNLIDSETLLFNYLADIRQAVGDDGRLMLPELVEHIRGMSQQLAAAAITADNCELFRKDAERYRWLRNPDQDVCLVLDKMVSSGVYEYRAGEELDAAIDAARSAGGGS